MRHKPKLGFWPTDSLAMESPSMSEGFRSCDRGRRRGWRAWVRLEPCHGGLALQKVGTSCRPGHGEDDDGGDKSAFFEAVLEVGKASVAAVYERKVAPSVEMAS